MFFSRFAALLETDALLASLALLFYVFPLLAAAGLAVISCLTAWGGRISGKVFAEKLALQVAEFGVVLLGLWLLLVSARWGLWAASWWAVGDVGQGFYPLFFDVPGHLAMVAVLASIVLTRTWRRSGRATAVHLCLGCIAAFLWLGTMAAFLAGLFWRQANPGLEARLPLEGVTAVLACPLPWLIWAQCIFLALAVGGGLTLVYLLVRRNREDFGRDYYGWAVQRCSWWAIMAGVVQSGWAIAVFWRTDLAGPAQAAMAEAGRLSLAAGAMLDHPAMPALATSLILAALSWTCLLPVLKSRTPLRMKAWMLLHVLLTALSATALSRMHVELWG